MAARLKPFIRPKPKPLTGYVHSIESMTAVDGMGLRFMVFLQGCARRCIFCSNPDTQSILKSTPLSVDIDTLMAKMSACRPYLLANGGGVTVSGGEPLQQGEFVTELFRRVKGELGLTTCIDTSGLGRPRIYPTLLEQTDTVLFCHKSFDPLLHMQLTKVNIIHMLKFLEAIDKSETSFSFRYVLMRDITDSEEEVEGVIKESAARAHCQGVEVLPYHTFGEHKYESMGLAKPELDAPDPELTRAIVAKLKMELEPLGKWVKL
eukprot:GHVN01084957.1.p1 GENE.GHVN01084957.1~~GHVN01084957.1.p1  ORF type:complete len:263 (+),score=36.71 GHVN01084957.1:373-1161(+)